MKDRKVEWTVLELWKKLRNKQSLGLNFICITHFVRSAGTLCCCVYRTLWTKPFINGTELSIVSTRFAKHKYKASIRKLRSGAVHKKSFLCRQRTWFKGVERDTNESWRVPLTTKTTCWFLLTSQTTPVARNNRPSSESCKKKSPCRDTLRTVGA